MEIKEYMKETPRTNAPMEPYDNLETIHMLMGMTTEVGELMDPFKKNLAYKKPIDWINVREELGDLMWYISEFCNINKIDLNQVLEDNINKLRSRFPEKFTCEDAIKRNVDKELSVFK